MITQNISIKSEIKITRINAKTKEIIDITYCKNALTYNGQKIIRNWLASITPLEDSIFNVDARVTHIAVGTSATTPNPSANALGNEVERKELFPNPDINCKITVGGGFQYNEVIYTIFLDETEANGSALQEIGIFSESFGNYMISRALCGYLEKTAEMQFEIEYKYTVGN